MSIHKRIFYFFVLSALTLGCTPEIIQPAPEATSILRGILRIEGREDSLTRNHSGAIVSLEHTSLSTVTDSQGSYVLENVPPGRYNIFFSVEGYDTATAQGVVILPPFGAVIPPVQMRQAKELQIIIDSVRSTSDITLFCSRDRKDYDSVLVFYFGRSSNVSPIESEFICDQAKRLVLNPKGYYYVIVPAKTLMNPNAPFGKMGFTPGEIAYVVAYTATEKIFDSLSAGYRWMNVRNRSNVVEFRIPY
jgi:hypothetical protein